MVFWAKRDPESSPARSGIQRILDSGFRRNDGVSDFCESLSCHEFITRKKIGKDNICLF
jgi:hypothetical protein